MRGHAGWGRRTGARSGGGRAASCGCACAAPASSCACSAAVRRSCASAPPRLGIGADAVSCTYPIVGGILSRAAAGTITFTQRRLDDRVLLASAIAGFHPTLAGRPGAPAWTGELYKRVQARIHVAISGDYFRRLIAEAGG